MIEIAGAPAGSAAAPNTATNAAGNGATNGAVKERVRSAADAPGAELPDVGPMQRICLAVLRRDWTTVALVAADPSAPVRPLAHALAEVSRAYRLRPLRIVDGAGASPGQVALLQDELAAPRGDGRVAIALDDLRRSPGGLTLLAHADAVVLVVRLGATALGDVEETAELVGRERVLGCVVAR